MTMGKDKEVILKHKENVNMNKNPPAFGHPFKKGGMRSPSPFEKGGSRGICNNNLFRK
jgi:hypothetical protein